MSAEEAMLSPSSSSSLGLPTELLCEIGNFQAYEGLRQCCQTSLRMNALTHSAATKTKQKLDDLYLGDIRLLADWFQCWMAKSQEIRTEFLQQSFVSFRTLVHEWWKFGEKEKKNVATQEKHGRKLFGMAALMDEFCKTLDQLNDKMTEVIEAEPIKSPTSRYFRLSTRGRLQFVKRRYNFVETTFQAAQAQLHRWLNEEVSQWAEIYRSFGPFLAADFYQELALCVQEMHRCINQSIECQAIMSRCTNVLFLRER